jgi:hypothetical protein
MPGLDGLLRQHNADATDATNTHTHHLLNGQLAIEAAQHNGEGLHT